MEQSIDYGMGLANVDSKTGIRYGVISQHSVSGDALNDMDYDYPLGCPDCGSDALVASKSTRFDFYCQSCKTWHMSDSCYGDEVTGFHLEDGEYTLVDCLDSDIMVIRSPYYTFAQYCSPCVPGAGNLDSPMPDGAKAYCLGLDWFDDYSSCPYTIYRVSDDSVVGEVTGSSEQERGGI